jgi:chromosome segregation protein
MKILESIKLVQFFLFEKQEIRLQEITGIFGPNASGKSSLVDAVQIAMFGANSRLVSLNAQADERTTTRTIRSYCLGMHDEVKRARDNATTYITLVWRDSITKEATSMGVCIYASMDTEGHEVRGRYILPGIELSMNDHLEIVNNEERPRSWETFRHALIERSKMFGEDPLYPDSERFIAASLLALRGSGGAPSMEAFKTAFRFALRMRFDKTVDRIVREDVLEARPTNINKFREVTESFRNLAKKVAEVKAKIEDGERVEIEFNRAETASIREVTWRGVYHWASSSEASESLETASDEFANAEDNLRQLNEQHVRDNDALNSAQEQAKSTRLLIMNHAAHKENGLISSEISKANDLEMKKAQEIRSSLSLIRNTLESSAGSGLLLNSVAVKAVVKAIDDAMPSYQGLSREQLNALLKPSVKESSLAITDLFETNRTVQSNQAQAEEQLKLSENALLRVKTGRSRLSQETERLLVELSDNGIHATPVCDLVNITDSTWQPVVEAYLGRNIEALLVGKDDEAKAFSIYRGLSGPRAIYGAKIVASSKQTYIDAAPGSVAELIEGNNSSAVAYLRRRFGDMIRAVSDADALAGKRTLTQDGMITHSGEYERIRPVLLGNLKIGGGDNSQKEALIKEISLLKSTIKAYTANLETIRTVIDNLRRISSEESVLKYMLDACEEMHTARRTAASLTLRLNDTADAEYVRLNAVVVDLEAQANDLIPQMNDLKVKIGRAEQKLAQCESQVTLANNHWEVTQAKVKEIEADDAFDREYASKQWDFLLGKFDDQFAQMKEHCAKQESSSRTEMNSAISRGSKELGTFREKYREQGVVGADDWRKDREWMAALLKVLRDTELTEQDAKMKEAFKASQDTFRADVAVALSINIDHLEKSMSRLNQVLSTCPVFSNGERYRFTRTIRPQLKSLLKFVKDIASYGPIDDLLGGAGEMPEEFRQLLDDKIGPSTARMQNPLDDYREFFEFDIEILREDSINKSLTTVGSLSKRLGSGSGGEHRAPLYVIAGAALASAYRLNNGNTDGIRLILLDEAFNKMDTANIVATMRYLEQLGLQIFMASPGDNLGTLTAFLHRYYDILRDVENSTMLIQPHDVSETVRDMFRSDLSEFNGELLANELESIRQERIEAIA